MKKRLLMTGLAILLIVLMLGFGILWFFYDIQHIEGQEIIKEVPSPKGTYTVTAYLNNGGATVDYAVLCSVKANDKTRVKNIYWQYRCEQADIVWLDEQTVQINGIELNVEKDIYDFRRE